MKQNHGHQISREHLKRAVQKLAAFASSDKNRNGPHLFDLQLRDDVIVSQPTPRLKRAIALTRSLLVGSAVERERSERLLNTLVTAIDEIKDQALLVEQLRHGDPSEQRLAAAAHRVIDQYNAMIRNEEKRSIKQTVTRYLYQKAGWISTQILNQRPVNLSKLCDHHIAYRNRPHCAPVKDTEYTTVNLTSRIRGAIQKLAFNSHKEEQDATKAELDAYRMKAITLLQTHGVPSLKYAMEAVHNTPIVVENKASDLTQSDGAPSIINLRQRLPTASGLEILLEGAFQRTSDDRINSIPISNSFRLSTRTQSSTFPSPALCCGWALCDVLIPTMPLHPERVPTLSRLLQRRQKLSRELFNNRETAARADILAKERCKAFERAPRKFIEAHRELITALDVETGAANCYFDSLHQLTQKYELLCLANQTAIQLFVTEPLHNIIHDGLSESPEQNRLPTHRLDINVATNQYLSMTASNTLALLSAINSATSPFEIATLRYVKAHGERLSTLCLPLAMAALTEQLSSMPPSLKEIHNRLQVLVYCQQESYLDDLTRPVPNREAISNAMMRTITDSTQILRGRNIQPVHNQFIKELSTITGHQ
ncbi:hypothetical protein SCG7086_AC_00400 [Chlamydiales bacterium SCGC AG-110-P3]|nr:hypothetical protein SCG7086_AC_00400 [Chlamydiales bacterium SCGC AG-110-P3]